eukprot:TRINITY_DN11584_c0_g1_i1.p6 TRINITY_DN11584_c0_g1~~TRINITY_DN11584_c0_g1_i1.p6  ORF type:complete len:107 (+),score=7.24 TRINITY_DN11584_c0_g1_i1:1709-2029(+)
MIATPIFKLKLLQRPMTAARPVRINVLAKPAGCVRVCSPSIFNSIPPLGAKSVCHTCSNQAFGLTRFISAYVERHGVIVSISHVTASTLTYLWSATTSHKNTRWKA